MMSILLESEKLLDVLRFSRRFAKGAQRSEESDNYWHID